jgi:hypothetical protein
VTSYVPRHSEQVKPLSEVIADRDNWLHQERTIWDNESDNGEEQPIINIGLEVVSNKFEWLNRGTVLLHIVLEVVSNKFEWLNRGTVLLHTVLEVVSNMFEWLNRGTVLLHIVLEVVSNTFEWLKWAQFCFTLY